MPGDGVAVNYPDLGPDDHRRAGGKAGFGSSVLSTMGESCANIPLMLAKKRESSEPDSRLAITPPPSQSLPDVPNSVGQRPWTNNNRNESEK